MFNFNSLNSPEPFNFFLCKPNGEVMYQLNGIDEETASITINLNNQCDLSFDYFRYINSSNDELVESNGYHDLVIGMKILVDKVGYFKIKYPPMKFDGNKETKTINATSIDCELEDKDLVNFKINTGTTDSLEYLVTYETGETEALINDYTGLPYDYIVFYNTYAEQLETILNKYTDGTYRNTSAISEIKSFCDLIPRLRRKVVTNSTGNMSITDYVEFTYDSSGEHITSIYLSGFNSRVLQLITFYRKYRNQLSLISLAIEKCNCNWTIGTIDNSLVNKKFQFDINGKNIYSFLTDNVSSVANCVFYFDLFKRKINIVLAKNIGKNSGVILDRYNLLNSLEVTCNSENIYTRYNVSGGNDIDIKYVNFGSTRITDLTYFINVRNEQNERIYVSDTLAEKYEQYLSDREIARKEYINLTKQYNQALVDIDNIKYRVPNDSLLNDWDSFTDAELNASLKTYNQLLVTLQSLYKEDYGKIGCNSDGSINENYIRNTEYWYDYYAYKITITQIEETIRARANGTRYADINNEAVLKKINAYKTEWSLYGTVELENKITAYNNSMQVLIDGEAIILKPNSQIAKKWSELNSDEKTEYGSYESNYKYNVYMKLYNEKISCQSYLNQLNIKLKNLETVRDTAQLNRNKLVKLVEIETYDRGQLGRIVTLKPSMIYDDFTEEEIQTINLLCIDKNYNNQYILTTSLDTTVSEVDIQYELLEDAKEQLSIESQPQVSFNADIENLLAMSEFKNFNFTVGNFVTLEYYDDYYVDMRLVSMTFNPCIPEASISVSFSNFIKSKSERTDISNILGLAVGNNSDSSGGGSNGNYGTFGYSNDIDVTISNTMLAKLLNTEMFGTRVSNIILDTIKVNEITAKYAKFEGLAKGTTIIDGKCIQTGYIIDQLYNGVNGNITNTRGSVINLETGKFSFAGGLLKFNGTALSVKGAVYADTGYIGGENGFVITAGKLYSNGHSAYNTDRDGVYIGTDYISLGSGGVTYFSRNGTGKIGAWNINASSIWRGNSYFGGYDGMYFGTSGLSISNVFKVDANGNLTITNAFRVTSSGALIATSATITGDITANTLTAITSGRIASWHFNSDAIYRISSVFGNASGMYFGISGLSITDKFKVWSNGSFNFGNGKLKFDGRNLTLGSDVTITWNQVSGANDEVTKITKNTVTTSYVNALKVTAGNVAAENITGTTITGKTIKGGTIDGVEIKGIKGTIGGFTIGENSLYHEKSSLNSSNYGVYIGWDGISLGSNPSFKVNLNGTMSCHNAFIDAMQVEDISLVGGIYFDYANDTAIMRTYPIITAIQGAINIGSENWTNNLFGTTSLGQGNVIILPSGKTTFWKEVQFNDNICVYGNVNLPGVYDRITTASANVRIGSQMYLNRVQASSLKKYKHSISNIIDQSIDAHRLYKVKPVQFIYNDDYISADDYRAKKFIPGFLVDNLIKDYPIVVDYDENGEPENWSERYFIAPMLQLIQEHHKQIEQLQLKLNIMECENNLLKQKISNNKSQEDIL